MNKPMNKALMRGFTLVELMIVVALISILATMATPALRDSLERNRSRDTASEIASVFRNARTQAMSRGEVVMVTINPNDPTATLIMSAAPNVVPGDPSTAVVSSCRLIADYAAAATQPANGIPSRVYPREDILEPDVEILTTGATNSTRVLCFSPTGRIYDDTGRPASDNYGACTRGFVVAIGQLPVNTDILSFNSTYIDGGGGYNLVCGQQAVGGANLSDAQAKNFRQERVRLRLAREEGHVYIVEVAANGSIVVEH